MTIKAVFLDVDGTTVDSEARNRRAIEDAARVGGYEIQPEEWDTLGGNSDGTIWAILAGNFPDLKAVFHDAASFERACLNTKLRRIDEVKKYGETDEAIRMLRRNDIDIAAVSNSITADAMASLEHAGHKRADFTFCLFRDNLRELGLKPKPEPDPYLYALKKENEERAKKGLPAITAEECLVLEDSKTGVMAGLNAGMTVVHITDEQEELDSISALQITAAHGSHYIPVKRAELTATCRRLITPQPG